MWTFPHLDFKDMCNVKNIRNVAKFVTNKFILYFLYKTNILHGFLFMTKLKHRFFNALVKSIIQHID